MIVWVYRRPPLMGGTMTYSAYGGLTIPYIKEGACFIWVLLYGFPMEAYSGPIGK